MELETILSILKGRDKEKNRIVDQMTKQYDFDR